MPLTLILMANCSPLWSNILLMRNISSSKFNATDIADQILNLDDPAIMKRTASKLPNFSSDTWKLRAPNILYKALCAKFTQNGYLKDELLDTGDLQLGEACRDPLFGTGLSLGHAKALDVTKWTELNLQGTTLMRVRQELKNGII